MELMITIASIAAVSGLAALGIVALPWSDREVRASVDAVKAVPEAVSEAAQRVRPVGTGVFA